MDHRLRVSHYRLYLFHFDLIATFRFSILRLLISSGHGNNSMSPYRCKEGLGCDGVICVVTSTVEISDFMRLESVQRNYEQIRARHTS